MLQILAIKALQSVSLPLSEIQSLLYGSSEEESENVVHSVQESNNVRKNLLSKEESFRTTRLKELEIEPGLALVVEEGWIPELDNEKLIERIRQALSTLTSPGEKPDAVGGEFDGKKEDFG